MERTRKPERKPAILTCDPSFTAWGWAVVRSGIIIDTGCIKTETEAKKRKIREGDDRVRRTTEIILVLLEAIKKHDVAFIVSELPHGSQNARAAIMMGVVLGIVQGMATALDIPVEWYSEHDAKKALFRRKTVSKKETIAAIDELYNVNWTGVGYKDEAVADAMAVYYAAECNSPTLKFINR